MLPEAVIFSILQNNDNTIIFKFYFCFGTISALLYFCSKVVVWNMRSCVKSSTNFLILSKRLYGNSFFIICMSFFMNVGLLELEASHIKSVLMYTDLKARNSKYSALELWIMCAETL